MSRRARRRGRRQALDVARPAAVLEAAAEIGIHDLMSWIVDGPDRPPADGAELAAWAAAR